MDGESITFQPIIKILDELYNLTVAFRSTRTAFANPHPYFARQSLRKVCKGYASFKSVWRDKASLQESAF